jgi:photosystem II stability/assembly factor-like uncharacterized protein
MRNIFITIIILIFGLTNLNAQTLNKLMKDKTKNYKVIINEIEKDKGYLDNASKEEIKIYNRWKWFWETRVDSSGSFEKYNATMVECFNTIYPDGIVAPTSSLKSASTLTWTCLGPLSRPTYSYNGLVDYNHQIGRGRILCIWVDPSNFAHLMVGADGGGLWESTNGGTNWNCLTNTLMTGGVSDIAVHPSLGDIYIVTGMHLLGDIGLSGGYSLGVFKSTNGGSTWTKLNITTSSDESFQKILINPTTPSILYALSNKKVYKSTNSGSSWQATSLSIPPDAGLRDILFKPNNPNTLYVSGENAWVSGENVIYRTTNAGTSWTDLSGSLTGLFPKSRIAIATNPTDDDELYAFYCNISSSDFNKIEKSEDGGNNWSVINSTDLDGVPYALTIKLSPNGDIYIGGIKIRKSTNGGSSFTQLTSNYIHDDIMDIEFPNPINNNLIYVACDGGVYMDDAGGSTWDRINGNLATNEFYSLGIIQGNSNKMIGGTHDCGTYMRDNNENWSFVQPGDGGTSLLDQRDNGTYYYMINTTLYRNPNKIMWTMDPGYYNAPLAMDPTNSDILYAGKAKPGSGPNIELQKSLDKGNTWAPLDVIWFPIREITICEANTGCIYYSTWSNYNQSSEVRKTTDGGLTWSHIDYSDISGTLSVAPINALYVHPYQPEKVWIVFGGFQQNDKIFYSEDGGDNWSNITGSGIPNIPIQCFEYDFLNQTMFVGTDVGVYYREMGSSVWSSAGDLPRAVISSMNLNKLTGDLVISTFGRGIWSTNLGDGYCYDNTPVNISSNITWGTNNEVCKDVNVNSGTLKVTANITMSYRSTITIKSGAKLEIDAGLIKNGKIVVETGGDLIIKNNGKIILNNTVLETKTGATMNFQYGEIGAKQ